MKINSLLRGFVFCCMILALTLSLSQPVTAQEGPDTPLAEEMVISTDIGYRPVSLYADPAVSDFNQAPAAEFLAAMEMAPALTATTFVIDYVPAGSLNLFEDDVPCTTFPASAKVAFEYATNIWASILNSRVNVPIHIQACWLPMSNPSILGYSGYPTLHKNFAYRPAADVWYPPALANGWAGADLNGSTPEMVIAYNSNFASNFYYGTDQNTPSNKYNLATVVLHEITHGLGFAGSMWMQGYEGSWGYYDSFYNIFPEAYDRFAVDGLGRMLINTSVYPNPSYELGDALTSNNLYFNGSRARAANNGANVKLYAPYSWRGGSSYAHLDEIFNYTSNALMTYSLSYGETNYDPGPITKAMLLDLGWPAPGVPPSPPTSLTLTGNRLYENLPAGIQVGMFSAQDPNPGDTFTYALVAGTGSTDNGLFSISGNGLMTKLPADYEGKPGLSIRVRVTDQTGRYTEAVFALSVLDANDPPSSVTLTGSTVLENQPAGTVIGMFNTVDPDPGNTHTYTLGCTGADNSQVSIVGNSLRTAAVLNREVKPALRVCVRSKDQGNLFKDQAFTITVGNVNEHGNEINLLPDWVRPAAPTGQAISWLFTNDPDMEDTFTYRLTSNPSYPDNSLFYISGNELVPNAPITRSDGETYTVEIAFWDVSGSEQNPQVVRAFTINVLTPVNMYIPGVYRE